MWSRCRPKSASSANRAAAAAPPLAEAPRSHRPAARRSDETIAAHTAHRLQISPLRFGIQRAESKRRFARPGDAGEDDQRISRNLEIDVFEVMFARAFDVHKTVISPAMDGGGISPKV